jgi:murein DD-endopeptidase MepM/ murein hydrolase activator NlpD
MTPVCLVLALAASPPPSPDLEIAIRPGRVHVERAGDSSQILNFDFELTNKTRETLAIGEIEVSVYDAGGKLQERRFVNENGARPSIDLIGDKNLEPGVPRLVFNPLFSYGPWLELASMDFTFSYSGKDDAEYRHATVTVRPEPYVPGPGLRLPLQGRVLVWDGHDFHSHHRRFDYLFPKIRELGFKTNVGRFAYDLVPVDEAGRMSEGDPKANGSWLGFGKPILAAGDGTVVAVKDSRPDDRKMDMAALATDHLEMFGNYVVVRHGPGVFALYGHIRQGSALCKAGDTVRAGQRIAAVGTSGSSIFPHLHFQLQTTADADGEGLPSYFEAFERRVGSRSVPVGLGQIDSGQIVEAVAR